MPCLALLLPLQESMLAAKEAGKSNLLGETWGPKSLRNQLSSTQQLSWQALRIYHSKRTGEAWRSWRWLPPCSHFISQHWSHGRLAAQAGNWVLCSQREMEVYGNGATCHHWQDNHWRDRQWSAGPAAEKTFLVPLCNSSQQQKEKQQGWGVQPWCQGLH